MSDKKKSKKVSKQKTIEEVLKVLPKPVEKPVENGKATELPIANPTPPITKKQADKKKKVQESKRKYECNPERRLKKFVQAKLNEELKASQKTPEENLEELARKRKRRDETGRRRRNLTKCALQLLDQGHLYDKDGNKLNNIYNVITVGDCKKYVFLDETDILFKSYKEDLELAEVITSVRRARPGEKEYLDLVQRLLDGDPDVLSMVSEKKIVVPIKTELDIDKLKKIVSEKYGNDLKQPHLREVYTIPDENKENEIEDDAESLENSPSSETSELDV